MPGARYPDFLAWRHFSVESAVMAAQTGTSSRSMVDGTGADQLDLSLTERTWESDRLTGLVQHRTYIFMVSRTGAQSTTNPKGILT